MQTARDSAWKKMRVSSTGGLGGIGGGGEGED